MLKTTVIQISYLRRISIVLLNSFSSTLRCVSYSHRELVQPLSEPKETLSPPFCCNTILQSSGRIKSGE